MLGDVLAVVFVVLMLGATFGAVPLSRVWRGRPPRRSPVTPDVPDVTTVEDTGAEGASARVIPFPAAGASGPDSKDEAVTAARRAGR
jgi:hypothetical protein